MFLQVLLIVRCCAKLGRLNRQGQMIGAVLISEFVLTLNAVSLARLMDFTTEQMFVNKKSNSTLIISVNVKQTQVTGVSS